MVLTLDPSVRSQALGGAYVAPADDGGALFWNPAGLQRVKRQEFGFAHAALFGEQTQDSAVYVRPAWRFGERETWAVGISHLADAPLELMEEGEAQGTARPSESVVSFGYARPIGLISFGLGGKYIRQVLFEETGSAYAVDAGVQGTVGRRGRWGVSLANFGTEMSLGSSKTKLPLVLRAGGAGVLPFFKGGHVLGSLQIDLPADDTVRERVGVEYDRSLGKEWRVMVRTGYTSEVAAPFTFGAGVERSGVGVNYSFSLHDDLGNSSRIDLQWRFGAPLTQEIRREDLLAQTRTALAKGQLSEADGWVKEARALSPHSLRVRRLERELSLQTADSLDPVILLEQARRSLEKGDLGEAELVYRKVLWVRPGNPDAEKGVEKIAALLSARRTEEARRAVVRSQQRKKEEFSVRAQEAMKKKEWALAQGIWKDLLGLDPGNRTAREQIDLCQKSLAREAHSRVLDVEAQRAEGLKKYEEGRDAYRAGNLRQAKIFFEEAVRLDPENKTFRRALDRAQQELSPRSP